jgi:hypothetical protein
VPVIVGRGGVSGGFAAAAGAGGRSGGVAGGFAPGVAGGFAATPTTGVIGFVGGSGTLAGIGGLVAGAPTGGVAVRCAVTDFARGAFAGAGTIGFAAAIGCVERWIVCDARATVAGGRSAGCGGIVASTAGAGLSPGINRSRARSRSSSSGGSTDGRAAGPELLPLGSATPSTPHCRSTFHTLAM